MAKKWFSAPSVAFIEGGALKSTWETIVSGGAVEGSEWRVAAGQSESYIATVAETFGPEVEYWVTIHFHEETNEWAVAVRENAPFVTNLYQFAVNGNKNWILEKYVSGTGTLITSGTLAAAPVTGDKISIRALGHKISCAIQISGVTTVVVNEHEDTSVTAAGKLGLYIKNSDAAVSAMGGGEPENEENKASIAAHFEGKGSLRATAKQKQFLTTHFAGTANLHAGITPFTSPPSHGFQFAVTEFGTAEFAGAFEEPGPAVIAAHLKGEASLAQHMRLRSLLVPRLEGKGSLRATSHVPPKLTPHLTGTATLTVHTKARALLKPHLEGVGSLTQHMRVKPHLVPRLEGKGSLTAHSHVHVKLAPRLEGHGYLTVYLTVPGKVFLEPHFKGEGTLTAHLRAKPNLKPHMEGHGSLTATTRVRAHLVPRFEGHGSLTTHMKLRAKLAPHLEGTDTLTTHTRARPLLKPRLEGKGSLSQHMRLRALVKPSFEGHGSIRATSRLKVRMKPRFTGHGELFANVHAGGHEPPHVKLPGVSVFGSHSTSTTFGSHTTHGDFGSHSTTGDFGEHKTTGNLGPHETEVEFEYG